MALTDVTDEEILRFPSGQAKASTRDQITRREHWRKPHRDDRGPESRLLPVEERDGTHSLAPHNHADGGGVTPQVDDPTGHGFAGKPDVTPEALRRSQLPGEDPEHKKLTEPPPRRTLDDPPHRDELPHPDDPEGKGYHGTVEQLHGKPRGESHVTHPHNAAPGHPALTNVGTIYDSDAGEPVGAVTEEAA